MVLHMIEADLCESSFLIPSRDMVVGSLVSCFRLFFFCLFLVKGLLRVRSPFQPHGGGSVCFAYRWIELKLTSQGEKRESRTSEWFLLVF